MTEPLQDLREPSGLSDVRFERFRRIRFRQALSRLVKAVVDRTAGVLLVILTLPVVLALAIVIAARLRVSPFFTHQRIGRHGELMSFPKLRTLRPDTHPYALKTTGAVVPVDRFCAFLRRRHLDELPQLWLVPIGRLSLVGPRPKMPERFEPTDPGYRRARQLVPQGCTGLWQIGHDAHHMVHHRPAYDFCYLQYGTFRMDLWILWRTLVLCCTGRRVRLADVPRWVIGHGWVDDQQIREVGGARFLAPRSAIGSGGGAR